MKRKYICIGLILCLIMTILAGYLPENIEAADGGKKKILFDTDIGNDVDDSIALTYLLEHKNVELVGITTNTGTPWKRAMLAEIICNFQNQDIPIYPGAEQPLNGKVVQYQMGYPAQNVVNTYPHSEYAQTNQAVDFMRRVIEDNPHEITLVCTGALTNAALLFSEYPQLIELLDGMIIMGGMYGPCDTNRWGEIEWNIKADPDAADIVFQHDIPNCLVVGVDVTSQFFISGGTLYNEFSKKAECQPIAELLAGYGNSLVYFHDILPLSIYLDGGEFQSKQGNIDVVLNDSSGQIRGTTNFTEKSNGRHRLITGYSSVELLKNYSKAVGVSLIGSSVLEEGELLYWFDFNGEKGVFEPKSSKYFDDAYTATVSEDGSSVTIKSKTGAIPNLEKENRNIWGGVLNAQLTNRDVYTLVYKAKANTKISDNKLAVAGVMKYFEEHDEYSECLSFLGNYSTDKNAFFAFSMGKSIFGSVLNQTDLTKGAQVDADGFMTIMVVYDGVNQLIHGYVLSEDGDVNKSSDWTNLWSALGATGQLSFMVNADTALVNTTIKDARIYKGFGYGNDPVDTPSPDSGSGSDTGDNTTTGGNNTATGGNTGTGNSTTTGDNTGIGGNTTTGGDISTGSGITTDNPDTESNVGTESDANTEDGTNTEGNTATESDTTMESDTSTESDASADSELSRDEEQDKEKNDKEGNYKTLITVIIVLLLVAVIIEYIFVFRAIWKK